MDSTLEMSKQQQVLSVPKSSAIRSVVGQKYSEQAMSEQYNT